MAKIPVSLEFKANTAEAKQKIQDLANSIAKVSQTGTSILNDVDLTNAVNSAKELESHLFKAMNTSTGKLDLSKFTDSLRRSGHNLEYFRETLTRIGPDGEQAFLELAKSIAQAEMPTIRVNKHLANLWQTLKNTAKWQLTSNITHGFESAIASAVGYAQDLNESLTDIRIVTGNSVEEMAAFAKEANKAAKALSTTTREYSDASLIFFQQGIVK